MATTDISSWDQAQLAKFVRTLKLDPASLPKDVAYSRDIPSVPAVYYKLLPGQGGALGSFGGSIGVTNQSHFITGNFTISQINSFSGEALGEILYLFANASHPFTLSTGGNIVPATAGGTRVIPSDAGVTLVWNGTSWYVAGVGS